MGPYPVAYHGVGDDAILSISDGRAGVLTNCKEGSGLEDCVRNSQSKTNFSNRDSLIFLGL